MKKLILLSLLVCSTLCYAQEDDPFGLYENTSSSSNTQKETIQDGTIETKNKELISKISFLEKENKELLDKYNKILEEKQELHSKVLEWKKVNKQLLEQIKGLQIEISKLKNSQKEWK